MEKQFEVRDKRAKDRFYLDDLYLNGYAKKCGIYATGVYISLCRHSNLEQICWPSIKKIGEELAISQKQVGRAIKILESFHIISKERVGKKSNNRYWLLSKSEWTDSPITSESDETTSPTTTDYQSDHDRTTSPFHSKVTHYKVTHSKESDINVADKELEEIINLFKNINPSYKQLFKNKTERAAAERMLKEYGHEQLAHIITSLPEIIVQPYAPRVTTPYQLEKKMGELIAFKSQDKNKSKKTWSTL